MEFKITFQDFEQLNTHIYPFSAVQILRIVFMFYLNLELLWLESFDGLYMFLW
jgi:hypothetical protein